MNQRLLMIMTISVASQVVKGQDLPQVFVEEPTDVSIREGADVLLHCKITAIGCRCQWTRGGEVIKIVEGSMYQYKSGNETGDCSLHIKRTSQIDENLWSCQLQTPLGTFTSRTAQISFIVPPEAPIIYVKGKNITSKYPIAISVRSPLHLECISRKGKPASTLEFVAVIPVENTHSFIQQSADDPHLQDSIITLNTYISLWPGEHVILCIAHHPGYNASLTARAKILVHRKLFVVLPIFTHEPRSVAVQEGKPAHLDCKLKDGIGCQWMRGGQVMDFTNDPKYQQTTNEGLGMCSLEISQTRPADENLWSCQMSKQNVRVISTPVQISFIVPPDPPIIRLQNQDLLEEQTIEVNQSQPFLLECVSRKGKPTSFLEWVGDMNSTNVQKFSQSNSEDPRLQDSILIWNTRGWSEPGNYTVQCTAQHAAYITPRIINVKFTVARDSIQRREQNFCRDKGFTGAEENAGYKSDFETTIAIAVSVIAVTFIGFVIGIYIKRRRSHIIATEAAVQIASFPAYLAVLPSVSKTELSNRPQFPLPRGTIMPDLEDEGSDCDNTYAEIDDHIISCAVNYPDHQAPPFTESVEFCSYQVPSLDMIADESQHIYYPLGNEQTSPL